MSTEYVFDKAPAIAIVLALGGLHQLPGTKTLTGTEQDEMVARAIEFLRVDCRRKWTLWEADEFCCDFLGMHPMEVYGEAWLNPPTPDPRRPAEVRDLVAILVREGKTCTEIAEELDVPWRVVLPMVQAATAVPSQVRSDAALSSEVVSLIKRDILAGVPRRVVLERHGIKLSAYKRILEGRAYTHVQAAA